MKSKITHSRGPDCGKRPEVKRANSESQRGCAIISLSHEGHAKDDYYSYVGFQEYGTPRTLQDNQNLEHTLPGK